MTTKRPFVGLLAIALLLAAGAEGTAQLPSETPGNNLRHENGSSQPSQVSLRKAQLSWRDAGAIRRTVMKAVDTKDYRTWAPAVGDLMNPEIRREDAIAILSELLTHDDWRLRIRAAEALSELGSPAGVEALRQAVKASASSNDIPAIMLSTAVRALQRAGVSIDEEDLEKAHRNYRSDDLLKVAAQEGHPWVLDIVRERRRDNAPFISTELLAIYLGMGDAESIARYQLLLTGNAAMKVVGNWALYRATGAHAHFQYVVNVATTPGNSANTAVDSADAISTALHLISVTPGAEIEKMLEKVADTEAGKESPQLLGQSGALATLYFTHKDHAFIDDKIVLFLQGTYPTSGAATELMWKFAAARRSPAIEELAWAKDQNAFDRYFVRMEGRPLRIPPVLKGTASSTL